jgi:hypothetical protein
VSTTPRYWMWHNWRDEHGRTWAAPHHFAVSSEARRAHDHAAAFDWVTSSMRDPHVSALYASDGRGVVELQPERLPASKRRDKAQVASLPLGPGQVSSVVKAEAQRRDPGSIPGGSTALPFR